MPGLFGLFGPQRYYITQDEHKELLDYIDRLNTENVKYKTELLKLQTQYEMLKDKLTSYMHQITTIEQSLNEIIDETFKDLRSKH